MQNSIPQKHVTTIGYQIFGFEVEGQEHIVEASIVRAQGLSGHISTTNSFSDLLFLIVSKK